MHLQRILSYCLLTHGQYIDISNAKHFRKQNDSWKRERTKLSWTRNQMLQRKQFNRNGYLLAKRLQKLLRAAFLYDTPFYFGAGIHTRRHFAGFSAIRHLSSSCLMSHLIRTWRERSINVIFVHNDIKSRRELSDWGNIRTQLRNRKQSTFDVQLLNFKVLFLHIYLK